jgi:hypothetical protein
MEHPPPFHQDTPNHFQGIVPVSLFPSVASKATLKIFSMALQRVPAQKTCCLNVQSLITSLSAFRIELISIPAWRIRKDHGSGRTKVSCKINLTIPPDQYGIWMHHSHFFNE